LDDGELEAELLSKVTTVALEQESVSTSAGAGVDVRKDGLLHVVKGKRVAPLPSGPEQFRAVIKVMALHWEMVHLKGAGRTVLRDYNVGVFDRHVDYILGDECMLIAEANPTMSYGPSWDLLMKYEHEVRRLAIRKVNEGGCTLAEGMAQARADVPHRTSYFITPLAMPGSRAHSAASHPSLPASAPEPRGSKRAAEDLVAPPAGGGGHGGASSGSGKGGKGKGKGKGAGKGKDIKHLAPRSAYRLMRNEPSRFGVHFKDAEGKLRCHAFQAGLCNATNCKFAHVCARCGGAHGATRCPELGLDKV